MRVKALGREVDAERLLVELHAGTRALGFGAMHDIGRRLTVDEARGILRAQVEREREPGSFTFDYVLGRPIKVTAREGVIVSGRLYERDAGDGAFAAAVERAASAE